MNKRKLNALIALIDDPDTFVAQTVEKELLKATHSIIPALEEKAETCFDENRRESIETLIRNLQFKQTRKLLRNWIKTEQHDFMEGVLLIEKFQHSRTDQSEINRKIETIKSSIWIELSNSHTILEKTTIMNHCFFNVHGFSVNHHDINSPKNCSLNYVLNTKQGNPLSISILYTIIARQLNLPAQFVDFPENPLLAIVDPELARKVHKHTNSSGVLFYIDTSEKGAITGIKEIEYFLKQNNYKQLKKYTEPQPDSCLIKAHLRLLMKAYRCAGFPEKEEKIKSLYHMFNKAHN